MEARQREYRLKRMKRSGKIKKLGIEIGGPRHSCTFAYASEKDPPVPENPFNSMLDKRLARQK